MVWTNPTPDRLQLLPSLVFLFEYYAADSSSVGIAPNVTSLVTEEIMVTPSLTVDLSSRSSRRPTVSP